MSDPLLTADEFVRMGVTLRLDATAPRLPAGFAHGSTPPVEEIAGIALDTIAILLRDLSLATGIDKTTLWRHVCLNRSNALTKGAK